MRNGVLTREGGSVVVVGIFEGEGSKPYVRLVATKHEQAMPLSLTLEDAHELGQALIRECEAKNPALRVTLPEPG